MSSFYQHFTDQEWKLLIERAKRANHALKAQATGNLLTALLIQLEQETYALPIQTILGIYEQVAVTRLPHTPPHIYGIANVRGHLITVLALSALLQITDPKPQNPATLVVLDNDQAPTAFYIPEVIEVVTLDLEELHPLTFAQRNHTYARGVFTNGVILLNVTAILQDPALLVNQS